MTADDDYMTITPSESRLHVAEVHDDVIKWQHFPRHCPFVRGIHRSPVNSPYIGQWCGVICAWLKYWVNNREDGDLIRHRGHYDVIVMYALIPCKLCESVWYNQILQARKRIELGSGVDLY